MRRSKWFLRVSIFCIWFGFNAVAVASQQENNWFLSVGYGISQLGLDQHTTVQNGAPYLPPYDVDRYTIKTNAHASLGQLGIGYRLLHPIQFVTNIETSLNYQHFFSTAITGNIQQYSLPEFNNYRYQVKYEADAFMLAAKFNFLHTKIMPYVSAGIGLVLNHINDYREQAEMGVTPRTNPNYQGTTLFNPAAMLGLGFDINVTHDLKATLGYAHYFQGNLKTDVGKESWASGKLKLGNLKLDTFFISISAIFPDAFWS